MKKGLMGLAVALMLFMSGGCSSSDKEDEGILGVYTFDRVDIMHDYLPGFVEKTISCTVDDVTADSSLEEICSDEVLSLKELEIELKDNYEAIVTLSINGYDKYKAKTTYGISDVGALNISVLDSMDFNFFIRGNELLFEGVLEGEDQTCEQPEGGLSSCVSGKYTTFYYVYKKT